MENTGGEDLTEQLQGVEDFTTMTGLFPGGVLSADWLDTWTMPGQSANIAYNRELQSWT
jgi:hypothetical protein